MSVATPAEAPAPPPEGPPKLILFLLLLIAAVAALFAVKLPARYEALYEWRFRVEGSNVDVIALGPASLERATYLAAAPDGQWLARSEVLPAGSAGASVVGRVRDQVRGDRLADRLAGARPRSAQTFLRATEPGSGVTLEIWGESTLTQGFGDRLRVSTDNAHPKAPATVSRPFGGGAIVMPPRPPADAGARRAATPGLRVMWYHPTGPMVERLSLWQFLGRANGPSAVTALAQQALEALGAWGPVCYVAAYVAGAVIAFPSMILTIGGALAFGFWAGFLYVTVAANLGAAAAFFVARGLGRDAIERRLPARLTALNARLEEHGFATVLLLRFLPVSPYSLTNYACGLSRMRYRDFLVGSLIGMMPATLVWTSAPTAMARLSFGAPLTWAPFAALLLCLLLPRLLRTPRARPEAADGPPRKPEERPAT